MTSPTVKILEQMRRDTARTLQLLDHPAGDELVQDYDALIAQAREQERRQ